MSYEKEIKGHEKFYKVTANLSGHILSTEFEIYSGSKLNSEYLKLLCCFRNLQVNDVFCFLSAKLKYISIAWFFSLKGQRALARKLCCVEKDVMFILPRVWDNPSSPRAPGIEHMTFSPVPAGQESNIWSSAQFPTGMEHMIFSKLVGMLWPLCYERPVASLAAYC